MTADAPARDQRAQASVFERRPPADLAAEQSVLGGMLMSADAIADVVETLTAGDFYKPIHGTIFETVRTKFNSGEPADAVTVAAALADAGQLEKVGGGPYLHTLLDAVPTAANAGYYARIVKNKAIQRRLIEAGAQVVQYGYGAGAGGRDLDEILVLAEKTVLDALDTGTGGAPVPVADYLTGVLDSLEADQIDPGLSTGLADLDKLLGGLRPGQLVVIAARPAMGKSILAADFARHASLHLGIPTLLCSLEMSGEELAGRLICAEAGGNLGWFTGTAQIPDDQIGRTVTAATKLADAPLFIDAATDTTITRLRSKARRLAAQHRDSGGLGLVVVDYLQLMPTSGGPESREREIAEISRGLKLLAKDLACPVVALSQLNRNVEGRQDKRPLLSDLRESGAIEQDSDVVLLLHREDYYEADSPRQGEIDINVAKNRGGRCDTITAAAQLHKARIVSLA
ncbi:replicative DNA helicase [Glycomyces salinus]|uniref:replicative DNA helicase n=1 Tax=Glycomyces salinus TaxID=980294 RepID=UPI0018EB1954|nr:replicative DNA helicase [Glycomyces salinus]